jgi:tetratricopeptide (TPR) repeat protein
LECRTETENFEWCSYINFKQDAAKQSLLEEFNIPFLSDEARGGGFEQIASDQKSTTLAFNNESIALEVQYMTSGQIIIRKAEKNDKKIGTKSIRSIDYGPTTTEEGEEVEKLLRNLKSEANAAETFLPEALRKHTEHHSRYQKLVKEMIQEILEYHPNYYFGWLDLGSYAYDFEKKPEKAFFYIKKAMKMYPDRPAAYSILYSIYVNDENLEEAGKTESTADGRLNALDRFQFDSTRIKLLIRFGKTELAEKLFEERKGLYQGKEFEYGLEVLKNSLRGEATVRDYQ